MNENEKILKSYAAMVAEQAAAVKFGADAPTSVATQEAGEAGVPKNPEKKSSANQRKARAAAKLRENLLKRKQQLRARRAGDADDTVGLPAAKSDESS